jgi:hypothetical protein
MKLILLVPGSGVLDKQVMRVLICDEIKLPIMSRAYFSSSAKLRSPLRRSIGTLLLGLLIEELK